MPPSRTVGIAGTTLAHAALIAFALWAAQRANRPGARVYEVNLVAAPALSNGPTTPVEKSEPAPPVKAPPVKPKAAKVVVKQAPVETKPAAPAPTARNKVAPMPGEAPSTGQDAVTLHQKGLEFPFQYYLDKIYNEILRRWNQANLRPGMLTAIAFVINQDGTVPDSSIVIETKSGSYEFDQRARGAIESAAAQRAFGPLPSGFNSASLPILFKFTMTPKSPP